MHRTEELKEETDKYNIIILPDFSTPTEHYIEDIKNIYVLKTFGGWAKSLKTWIHENQMWFPMRKC